MRTIEEKIMYCTKEDIEMMLNLKFDTSTVPTANKVNSIILSISQEMNMVMNKAGLRIPITEPNALGMLSIYAGFGAAGLIALSYGGNMESVDNSQGSYYRDEYKAFLENISLNPGVLDLGLNILSGVHIVSSNVTDGYTDERVLDNRIGDDWVP